MPRYEIIAPDGRKFEISAPEGATQEQALAYAQQQFQGGQGKPQESKQQKYERLLAANEQRQPSDPMHPSNNPTTGMSGYQRSMAAAGKSFSDILHGGKQLLGMESSQQADERAALDAPLMATGAGKGGYVGGVVASLIGPGLLLKAASAVPQFARAAPALNTASRAFLPTTARGAAAQGGVIGALQPVGTNDSRAGNIGLGALAGSAGVLAPRAIGAGYRSVRNAALAPTTTGAEREAVRTIRSLVDDPNALLKANPSSIPGASRTLFEESLVPGVARLETKARGANGDFWKQLDSRNIVAREKAVRSFAGDEGTLAAAITARSKAANPLYAAADKVEGVDTSRLLSQIKRLERGQEGRPAVQKGLADVRQLLTRPVPEAERKKTAIAAMRDFSTTGRKSAADFAAAQEAMRAIRRGEVPAGQFTSQAGKDALKTAKKALKTESMGQDKMRVIANARLTINDMLGGKYGGDSGQAMAGSRALMAVKSQLDRVAAKHSPEFAKATQTFRSMSGDINRMQAGQELLRRGSGNVVDPLAGTYPLLPGKFGGQAKNLDSLAQSATGFRKAQASNVFKPEDIATIGAVNDDLSRSAARLTYGAGGGSHTASQAELGIKLAGKALLRKAPWIGPAIEHLDAAGQTRVMAVMSEMLANPAEYRRVAAALPANEQMLVQQIALRLGGSTGAMSPALLNAGE